VIPFKDENPTQLAPIFTIGLIAANVAAWLLVQGAGAGPLFAPSICEYGIIPVEITGKPLVGPLICKPGGLVWGTLFTSMFMHGGWLHLISNMLFLWVFGNNIEDSMGHVRYLLFYVLSGLAAAGTHLWLHAGSGIPTVGASGAISGVLGAYIVLYPQARVHVYFPPFWIFPTRAYVMLGYWILIQLLVGLASLGAQGAGGVAVWAHIGGFFAGLVMVKFFQRPQLVLAKREGLRLDRGEIRRSGYWW
jgi:membrane associated rhomboid family serine protease